jgi:hypothetical protein
MGSEVMLPRVVEKKVREENCEEASRRKCRRLGGSEAACEEGSLKDKQEREA